MKRKEKNVSTRIGTGYVSIIMIFVVISIAVLSVLSLSAAGSNEKLGEKAREQMGAYYSADAAAKKTLMEIDTAAFDAARDGVFSGFVFEAALPEGVDAEKVPEGYRVSWSETVTEKMELFCEVTFFAEPGSHSGKRFTIEKWSTASAQQTQESVLSVWDGTF